MICHPCKLAADNNMPENHKACLGKTRCDCQHAPLITEEIKTWVADRKAQK